MNERLSDAQRIPNRVRKSVFVLSLLTLIVVLVCKLWPHTERDPSLSHIKTKDAPSLGGESATPPVLQHADTNAAESGQFANGKVDPRAGWSKFKISLRQAHDDDSFQKGLWGFALSEEEARWMDRQGMPAPTQVDSSYGDMSLEELLRLARDGDLVAARIGAQRARNIQWATGVGAEVRKISLPILAPGQVYQLPTESDRQQLNILMDKLFQTAAWNRLHEFLWQGVVNGSSYAALEMRRAYWDASNTCYKPTLCEAWGLVAWRMGNWEAQPGGPVSQKYAGVRQSVSSVMTRANFLWSEINKARAERGLAALQIDLRPNFDEWQRWEKHPEEARIIYRR